MKIDPETEISKIIDAVHIFRDKREKTIYKQKERWYPHIRIKETAFFKCLVLI
mgnify:CR=1 FL=1